MPTHAPPPDTGNLEDDLKALVDETLANYARREMVLGLPGLQADLVADPELLEETEQRYTQPHFQRWRVVFERALERGELSGTKNVRAVFAAATGAITVLVQEGRMRRRAIGEFVTQLLLAGVRRPHPPAPERPE